jgi:translation initiation factor IF-2
VLVQKGLLKVGDSFVAGIQSGKVRAMSDERGNRMMSATSSMPVQILGFDGVPQAGDGFGVVENDREARDISLRRQQLKREQDFRLIRSVTLDDLSKKIQDGQVKELKVVVKGDVDGSVGALADSLMKITHAEVRVHVIHRAVGAISESDVLLAAASGAIIIGFHVRPNLNARRLAEQENVDIRVYNIIYDAIEDIKKALEGLLSPEKNEEITATIDVREVFKVPKVGAIAGCYVQDGKITRGNKVRLVRDGIVVFEGGITSLKRFKDDVREVESGFECGIGLEGFNDIKVGDTIEAFKIVETQRKLA